jgi:NAD(P)-dependent dehydrogenase (short-subunit alcohol dehydrogenase family)
MRLRDKVAIVTGSTRGIGEACVRVFYREGARVIITGRDQTKGLSLKREMVEKKTSAEFATGDERCAFVKADVSLKKDVMRLRDEALDAFGRIDILVNNAGINVPSPFEDLTEEAWDKVMSIDLKGVLFCSQIIGREMIKQRSGTIVNIASIAGHYAFPDGGAYGPAKSATIMVTKQCAVEWAKYNIRVNSISPGLIRTAMSENIYQDEEATRGRIDMIPLGRIGNPEDVAYTALFLCSDESSFITGQDVLVDGGLLDNVFQKIPGRAKIREKITRSKSF